MTDLRCSSPTHIPSIFTMPHRLREILLRSLLKPAGNRVSASDSITPRIKTGLLPAALNAADEAAVDAFLRGKLLFDKIAGVVEETLEAMESEALGASVMNEDEILRVDAESRKKAKNIIGKMKAK